jgi:exopolyphosphatase/guanosine-5'-triphosphate,3'-diphosphate pyrophosphatase
MDIGGGSTEFIIGVDQDPLQKESFRMGCVSMSLQHFPGGKITAKRFRRAVIAAQRELEPIELAFRRGQWSEAVGASGSLRAIQKIILAAGWGKSGISSTGLERLAEAIIEAGDATKLPFPELNPERAPVLPGGVVIVYAAFKILGIELMKVADGALREGLLYDLLGRLHHSDIRTSTVAALASRYHVDREHAGRIQKTARDLARQALAKEYLDLDAIEQWLGWSAELHEIGFDIAHSGYHKHGAYIVENADLPGFSQQEQKLLATLVRSHRRKFPVKLFKELAHPWDTLSPRISIVLRLAVLLNRSRHPTSLPALKLRLQDTQVVLEFPSGWLADHPLTTADLEQEAEVLQTAGITLRFA